MGAFSAKVTFLSNVFQDSAVVVGEAASEWEAVSADGDMVSADHGEIVSADHGDTD